MEQATQTPVLIVGGGPVGLALSIDLSWRGIRHVLVEQAPRAARANHPRMDQVGIRSMEHFRRLGIAADIEDAGFPREMRRDIVFATGVLGYELAREPFEADATRQPPPFSPQKHELCPQNFLDPALQTIAERSPLADIRYNTRLVALDNKAGCVRCELEVSDDGRHYALDAQYLAGCDGSGSVVASQLGVDAAEHTTLACSTNIFIDCPELRGRVAAPGAYRYLLIGPEGVWASMVNMDGRDMWRLQVLGNFERQDWTEAEARAAIDRSLKAEVSYRLMSIVPWIRRELIADRFAAGRGFLVGDAAHQFSPTGGYGMNTGLQEAFNLSWKLEAILSGWGGAGLLDSYEIERRPIAIRNAQRATVNFERMRSLRSDPRIDEPSAEGDSIRQRVGQQIQHSTREEWESMGIHLGYSYSGSPLVVDDGAAGGHSHPADYQQSSLPGARAPHVWLADGKSILDLFGRGFVLLQFDRNESAAPLLAAAEQAGVPMLYEQIDNAAAARLYERRFVLVRPDGHVAMRADHLPRDVDALIDRVRGACASRPAGTLFREHVTGHAV